MNQSTALPSPEIHVDLVAMMVRCLGCGPHAVESKIEGCRPRCANMHHMSGFLWLFRIMFFQFFFLLLVVVFSAIHTAPLAAAETPFTCRQGIKPTDASVRTSGTLTDRGTAVLTVEGCLQKGYVFSCPPSQVMVYLSPVELGKQGKGGPSGQLAGVS